MRVRVAPAGSTCAGPHALPSTPGGGAARDGGVTGDPGGPTSLPVIAAEERLREQMQALQRKLLRLVAENEALRHVIDKLQVL